MKIFWIRYLSVVLVLAPLMSVRSIKASAAVSISLAQANSTYDKHMQLGYDATGQRNYSTALTYFKQALQERPGDRYASVAIHNIEGYIVRASQVASLGKNSLIYIPPSVGIPSDRVPAASRGASCSQGVEPLTALIPKEDPVLTTAGYPSFFFYVPKTVSQAWEFVIQDANDEQFYKATFKPSEKPGVVSLRLPAKSTKAPLEIGKEYHWSFSVICDPQDRSEDLVVEGSIKRVAADQNLTIELKKASLQEQAAIYATTGFWQDALATIAELRRSRPGDSGVKTDWEGLLKSVGLEKIAQEPLMQCCIAQQ